MLESWKAWTSTGGSWNWKALWRKCDRTTVTPSSSWTARQPNGKKNVGWNNPMKQLERRIQRIERAYRPEPKDGVLLHELVYICEFAKRWPDPSAAPPRERAPYLRILKRFNAPQRADHQTPVGTTDP